MLFGHQDNANQPSAPATVPSVGTPQGSEDTGVNPLAVDPATGVSLPVAPPDDTTASLDEPSILDQPTVGYTAFASDPAPTTPFGSNQAVASTNAPAAQLDPTTPVATTPALNEPVAATPAPEPTQSIKGHTASTSAPGGDDLLDIKQQALSQLGPLVSHLDQTPEEKFRTTMMLIQSADNSALLKDAYEAAQSIPNEKVRAQALLDIVNEINYFTQRQPAGDSDQAQAM